MSKFEKVEQPSIADRMRASFVPQGTARIVALHLNERFFDSSFIEQCIQELEKLPVRATLGEPPTALEKLAYTLLCDSAYI